MKTNPDPARRPLRRLARAVWPALIFVPLIAVGLFLAQSATTSPGAPKDAPLTRVLDLVESSEVVSAEVDDGAGTVTVTLADDSRLKARIPISFADELTSRLIEEDIDVEASTSGQMSAGADLAMRVVPIALILLLMVWAVRKATPSGMLGSKKKKALTEGEIPTVTFADVAGADEAVAQLQEMVQFLREPGRFEAVGAKRPRGALLVGPPGTGKTLLARAVAGEAQVPFFSVAGSDFVETFVGLGARRVRDLFNEARNAGRAIIFIDEIDAVGRTRSAHATHGGDSERESTLVAMLAELDGFAQSQVIVLAATNRADTLDPALTRPGRLDRQIQVPNPDRRGRTRILRVHAQGRPVGDDVDLVQVARQTPGMSGADLAQLVNEACMEAARRGLVVVDAASFQAAVATVAMGRARESALVTPFDREVTAWHESGHAVAASVLPEADDPVSVTIVPRGPAGGVTWMSGNDDIFLTRRKALAQLTVALAGRAAEEVLLDGEHTQGASGDLQSATRLATAMVTQYGMTEFGFAQVDEETLRVGGEVAAAAHRQINMLLADAHSRATTLVAQHAVGLRAVAEALLAEETLPGDRVREMLAAAEPEQADKGRAA